MSVFRNIGLSRKIGASFGFVLLLLIAASYAGFSGLQRSEQGFVQYRELARDTNLSGRLQANMLMVRMDVKNYLISHDESFLRDYESRISKMTEFLHRSRQEITNPERARLIREAVSLVQQYQSTFNEVVGLVKEEDRLFEHVLAEEGPAMRKAVTELVEYAHQQNNEHVVYSAGKLQEDLLLGRLYLVRYLEKHRTKDFEFAISKLETSIASSLTLLQSRALDQQSQQYLAVFKKAQQVYLEAMQSIFKKIEQRNRLIEQQLDKIGPMLANNVEQVKMSVMAEQDLLGPQLQQSNTRDLIAVSIISLVAISLGILFATLITRMISNPIRGAVEFADTLAQGDLTRRISVDRQDEVGQLQQSLGNTSQRLRDMIGQILNASSNMSSSADQLATLTEKARSGTLKQQQETDQVANAVAEMADTAQHVAKNASQAAHLADLADSEVESGRARMEQACEGMASLSESLHNTSTEVVQLQQKTRDINSILDVIREIAEQTNLLALNAAIEAARAGEQGRGFAVVADEVRSLALRTQQSTEMIHNLIDDLQARANQAVSAMQKGAEETTSSIERVQQAERSLDQIYQTVAQMNDMNMQIASAAEQQSALAEQIDNSVNRVRVIAEQSTESVEETAQSSLHLSEIANGLKAQVERFRLST